MLEIFDFEQGSPEWLAARCGLVTASAVHKVLAKGQGKTRDDYMNALLGETWTGEPDGSFQGNDHTARGQEDEPVARALYAERAGIDVVQCGLMVSGRVGYSPDGTVGDTGLIEIKSKLPKLQIAVLRADKVPSEHVPQIQCGLMVSGREWLDFISYSRGTPLFVKRVYRDEPYIKTMQDEIARFYEEMDAVLQSLMEKSA